MAYDATKPFSYGIEDGTYTGRATTAKCFQYNGKLVLDVWFAVMKPGTGEFFKKENGYNWEAKKRFWLAKDDGTFNTRTIDGLREWAKGWNPQKFDDFYWFEQPDEYGVQYGNLSAIGPVELNFVTREDGRQDLFVHDPDRPRGGRKTFVPDGAITDEAQIKAKWAAKAKALFAPAPKPLAKAASAPAGASVAAATATTAPAAAPAPARRQRPNAAKEVEQMTADLVFEHFCNLLGEPYNPQKHEGRWYACVDCVNSLADPHDFTQDELSKLIAAVNADAERAKGKGGDTAAAPVADPDNLPF